jgi:cell division septation protein DedD
VLVALGVWLFPMILNGPDDAIDEAERLPEIVLPAAEPIVPLRTDNPIPDRAAADPSPFAAVDDDPAASDDTPHDAAAGDSPAGPGIDSARSSPSGPPAADTAPPVTAASTSPAPPATAAASSARPQDPGGWSVQLGAFGEKANADQLASRVATYGYDAFVADFRSNGATMYRVRVGGFASEAQADAAAGSISAHSIPARVISPE